MDYAAEYEDTTLMLNKVGDKLKEEGREALDDGMYNYLLGKQSILREILQEKLNPIEFHDLERKAYKSE
jgi:hypothetical protein